MAPLLFPISYSRSAPRTHLSPGLLLIRCFGYWRVIPDALGCFLRFLQACKWEK